MTIPAATIPAAPTPAAPTPAATTRAATTRAAPTPAAAEPDPADVLAAAVLAVDGVAGLHGGMFGEVGTYLPGRRVAGVALHDAGAEVHIAVRFGVDVQIVATAVRAAAAPLVGGPVDVVIEDVELAVLALPAAEPSRTP